MLVLESNLEMYAKLTNNDYIATQQFELVFEKQPNYDCKSLRLTG